MRWGTTQLKCSTRYAMMLQWNPYLCHYKENISASDPKARPTTSKCMSEVSGVALLDVGGFDPWHQALPLDVTHDQNESEKVRAYGERIQNAHYDLFSHPVFMASGGLGPRANIFCARFTKFITEKKRQPRTGIEVWVRCRLLIPEVRPSLPKRNQGTSIQTANPRRHGSCDEWLTTA